MKSLILTLIISLLIILSIQLAYAQYGGPAVSSDATVYPKLGKEFQLGQDEIAFFESGNTWIRFFDVKEDSRCPSDVTCVWQGRVTIQVDIQTKNESKNIVLSLENATVPINDEYSLVLLDVKPYPTSKNPIQEKDYVVIMQLEQTSPIPSPLKQFHAGIPVEEIKCKESLQLIQKKDGTPACVKPETKQKLIERGWAKISIEQVDDGKSMGGIQGVVLLGPTCPVVMDPPDPECADKLYETKLVVTTADQSQVIKEFSSDANGKFSIEVPPGEYAVRSAAASNVLPYCSSNYTIKVSANDYTEITVYCDTGIR